MAEEAGNGDLEDGWVNARRAVAGAFGFFVPDHATTRIAVADPLGGVVGIGLREAVGVLVGGDLLPVIEVEGDFDKSACRDVQLLVDPTEQRAMFAGGAKA